MLPQSQITITQSQTANKTAGQLTPSSTTTTVLAGLRRIVDRSFFIDGKWQIGDGSEYILYLFTTDASITNLGTTNEYFVEWTNLQGETKKGRIIQVTNKNLVIQGVNREAVIKTI